ncbi:MAG TPA: GAF domain-containing protein [Candidatus Binatia bacterium]|nr:GAF domain-containing protein [Candidatus Binatia bacterium]
MKLAFLDLPDERVDLISKARHDPNIEIVLVAHPDPEALALKIAEVLQIPHSTEPLDLLPLKPDRVALPSLASPSAAALVRAGISDRIFVTLEDLSGDGPAAPARPPEEEVEELNPIETWENRYDEVAGHARLSRIRAALALSEDRQFLFSEVLALAVEQSNADSGSIMVVDEDARELRIAFADGLSPEVVRITRLPLGEGIAGKVALTGISLIINEPVSHPQYREERDRSRPVAAMSAPLKAEGRIIGVINVSSSRPGVGFTDKNLAKLIEIAEQISGILDRTIRVARRDRDAVELRARREIEIAFSRKGLDFVERLRLAAGRIAELLGAEAVQIHLADESLDRFRTVSSAGRHGDETETPLHQGLLARALSASKPLLLGPRFGSAGWEGEEGHSNLLLAPLSGSRPLGVLALECVGEAAADPDEFEGLCARIAEFLARSIEGQADESELSRRSALLGNLADIAARVMTSHSAETLLSEVLGALRTLFPGGLVTARIRGEGGGFLFRSAFEGAEPEHQRALEHESTLARRAVESKREITSLGLAPDELRRVIGEHGVSAYALIPVRIDEDVDGVLGLLRPAARRGADPAPGLSRLDVQTLRKLTLYTSLSMENARRSSARPERTIQDPLTGLLAIAGFDARVEEEVKRAERYRERFLLTVLAVSDFDRLADQGGTAWADSFQKEFAQALRRNVREVDALARIGSGRFAVLSPASDKDGGAFLRRLETLLGQLPSVRSMFRPDDARLSGRQYYFPDEIATGGELLSLVRTAA